MHRSDEDVVVGHEVHYCFQLSSDAVDVDLYYLIRIRQGITATEGALHLTISDELHMTKRV